MSAKVAGMNWKASSPRIEIAAVWTAAACLGGAVGFAVARIAPLGAGLVEAGVAGLLVTLAGWMLIGSVDRKRAAPAFAAVDHDLTDDALLLDDPVDDEVLLLDDPLPELIEDARVVRLFAAEPDHAEAAPPLAGPSEMIARIEDFLGQTRSSAAVGERTPTDRAAAEDANAALHAALADIRRSLRQG